MQIRAKSAGKRGFGAWPLALVAFVSAHHEGLALSPAERVNATVQSSPVSERTTSVGGRILREIRDPLSGMCWLLMRDEAHPGGPGRLVQAEETSPFESFPTASVPVLRAGDRLIVEEETPVVAVRLEAVALGPAAVGGELDVRLKIGGKVLRVVALGPGRAQLQAEREAQR